VSQSAEAGDEPSVAYYLEALAAVAALEDNLERAVRLLAAAGALLQAKGSGWLHPLVPLGGSRAVEYVLQEAPLDPTRPERTPRARRYRSQQLGAQNPPPSACPAGLRGRTIPSAG
jgi:hypothetical protein